MATLPGMVDDAEEGNRTAAAEAKAAPETRTPTAGARRPSGSHAGFKSKGIVVVPSRGPSMRALNGGWRRSGVAGARSRRIGDSTKPRTLDDEAESVYLSREEIMKDIRRYKSVSKSTINPRSRVLVAWDFMLIVCLVYVALMVPFDVVFMEDGETDELFWVNRVVDVFFVLDMVVQCFLRDLDARGKYMMGRGAIAQEYLRGWFWVDLVSVLPFEVLGVLLNSEAAETLQLVRLVRLFRLFKLLRVLRASRLYARWEASLPVTYGTVGLLKFMLWSTFIAHWTACAWRIGPMVSETSWLIVSGLDEAPPVEQYISCLYWAVMTVATIGTGDILPGSLFERSLAILCMIIGGSAYAYIIGSVCAILSNRNRSLVHFRQRMDDLHEFNRENDLPTDLRQRLQSFFHFSQSSIRQKFFHDLLVEMSPSLRAEVALHSYGKWIPHVPFLRGGTQAENSAFAAAVALALHAVVFQRGEAVYRKGDVARDLFIVSKGLASQTMPLTTYRTGDPFGADAVLSNGQRRMHTVVAMTRTMTCLALSKLDLDRILHEGDFPEIKARLNWSRMQLAVRTGLVKLAKVIRHVRELCAEIGADPQQFDVSLLQTALWDGRGMARSPEDVRAVTDTLVKMKIAENRASAEESQTSAGGSGTAGAASADSIAGLRASVAPPGATAPPRVAYVAGGAPQGDGPAPSNEMVWNKLLELSDMMISIQATVTDIERRVMV